MQCVLFDLGGVILGSPILALVEYCKSIGLNPRSFGDILNIKDGPYEQYERGEISFDSFCKNLDALVLPLSAKFSASTFIHNLEQNCLAKREKILQFVHVLRQQNYVVGIITNNWNEKFNTLPADQLLTESAFSSFDPIRELRPQFDVIVESWRVKARKPEHTIFLTALQRVNEYCIANNKPTIEAKQVVFLDDIGSNCKGAKQVGFHTIKVESEEQAIKDVETVLNLSKL